MQRFRALAGVAGVIGLSGCNAAYAPPIRSAEDGAPGRMHQGELEGSVAADFAPSGGPDIGYAITDNVGVEGGAEIGEAWALAFAGARFTYQGRAKDEKGELGNGFVVDAGLGGGAGRGGSKGFETPAGGAYVLSGVGYYFPWIALYARGRVEQSFATSLPPTLWWLTTAGIQFWHGPFALFVETGAVGYSNDTRIQNADNTFEFWMPVQGGIAVHVDVGPSGKKSSSSAQTIGLR